MAALDWARYFRWGRQHLDLVISIGLAAQQLQECKTMAERIDVIIPVLKEIGPALDELLKSPAGPFGSAGNEPDPRKALTEALKEHVAKPKDGLAAGNLVADAIDFEWVSQSLNIFNILFGMVQQLPR